MPIKDYFMLKQVIFLNKVIQNEMPDYLSDSQYTRDVNCRPTKSSVCMSHFLYLPQPKTENFKRYYSYSSAFLWGEKYFTKCLKLYFMSDFKSVYLIEYLNTANI